MYYPVNTHSQKLFKMSYYDELSLFHFNKMVYLLVRQRIHEENKISKK